MSKLLKNYPGMTAEDIQERLSYAGAVLHAEPVD
jgi:uncharacterized protein (DUF433 family)